MSIAYTLAAFGIVPGLLGMFHWLSRVPKAAAPPPAPEASRPKSSLADEAERWLQSQV